MPGFGIGRRIECFQQSGYAPSCQLPLNISSSCSCRVVERLMRNSLGRKSEPMAFPFLRERSEELNSSVVNGEFRLVGDCLEIAEVSWVIREWELGRGGAELNMV